jgi:GNAT superfamily N-acetyltransferase
VLDPQFRGHGAGSRLMSHLLDRAFRHHRLREVRASVPGEDEDEDGMMLLSETGFMPYCSEERSGPHGRSRVVVQMRIDRRACDDDD